VRVNLYRVLLDHLRKWMAIKSQVLEQTSSSSRRTLAQLAS
jgi:hypothetical protein